MHRQPRLPYLVIALLLAGCAAPVAIPPSNPVFGLPASSLPTAHVGDIAVYRIRNAYNGEPLGETQYRVDKIDGGRVAVAVTTTPPSAGLPHTAVYTADGNWLRHPLRNHDQAIEYDFDPPLPAYALPLEAGKTWSASVNATNPVTKRTTRVRVDGEVLGSERINTPAGAFDVVKIRRRLYAGDWDGFLRETNITEFDWYAPALDRSVRLEINSNWIDGSRSPGGGGIMGGGIFGGNQLMRGDWHVYELIGYRANGKNVGGTPEVTLPAPATPR